MIRYRLLVSLASLVLFGVANVSGALAHTELVNANPPPESRLESSPNEIRLEFNEALLLIGEANPNQIEVRDNRGDLISGTTEVLGPIARVDLRATTGEITVRYRVVSSDGHRVNGQYKFTVAGNDLVPASTPEEPAEAGPNLLIRFIWALLLISAVGIVALLRLRK